MSLPKTHGEGADHSAMPELSLVYLSVIDLIPDFVPALLHKNDL